MSSKQPRGTKRTCQSSECGVRFYDLMRTPITCPICGSIYEIASSPAAAAAILEEKTRKPVKKPEYQPEKDTDDAPVAEGEEALADVEAGDDAIAPEGEDETFLEEEEEEGGNVSNIIGGPVAEGEEEA